ncbi:MAG: class I SAM-dependent methyltransferase [Actinomycetota bacterium]
MSRPGARTSGNQQKHESGNPAQRFLIDRFHGEVARLLASMPREAVLDLGCGEGFVIDHLVGADIDADFVGIDRSTSAVTAARARLGGRAEIHQADVTGLADLPRPFDVVMMLEVLEHLDDPDAMLALLAELTTNQVIVSVPWEPFFRGLNLLRLKNVKRFGSDPEHVQHWTRRGFERSVADHFEIVDRGRAFPWTLLLLEPRRPADR